MCSSRLPGKVLMKCMGKPMIEHQINRIKKSKLINEIIIATTTNKNDDILVDFCKSKKIKFFRGSELNVLDRVLKCAQNSSTDIIVETPGDCPLVDYRIVDKAIDLYLKHDFDYVCNNLIPSFPGSFDVQVFSTETLFKVSQLTNDPIDQEHVSLYIYRNQDKFKCKNFIANAKQYAPDLSFQLDTLSDYQAISKIFESLYENNNFFKCEDVINLIKSNPSIKEINMNVKRKKV